MTELKKYKFRMKEKKKAKLLDKKVGEDYKPKPKPKHKFFNFK